MNISECMAAFRDGKERGKSGNVSFDDGVLYSYRMPIAWRRPHGQIFVVNHYDSPSVTTSKHITQAHGPKTMALPSEEVLRALNVSQDNFESGASIYIEDRHINVRSYQLTREGDEPAYLTRADVSLIKVPHYHQLKTKDSSFWIRTSEIPPPSSLKKMWRFMLKNPPRRRVQRRLQRALSEDRLAQCGLYLLEQCPDHTIPKSRLRSRGCTRTTRDLSLGIDCAPHIMAAYDKKDPEYFQGTWNHRLITPDPVPIRVLTGFVPILTETDKPVDLWDRPVVDLRRDI